MKIDSVVLRQVRMPLASPFETSGWKEEEKNCIIVELHSDAETGYGECAVTQGPWYSYETTTSAWHVMEDYIVPTVLGRRFKTQTDVETTLSTIRGHNMAKASFDMAAWDLASKQEETSLSKTLGGTATKIPSGVSVGIQKDNQRLLDVVEKFVDQGYRRIKIKIKPGRDIEQVTALREEFPDTPFMVDANGSYRSQDTPTLTKLDMFDLLMIEQPFAWDDLVEHANLQKLVKTPICLDESVSSLNTLESALALQSCRVLNIKPARVGGLTIARRIHDICKSKGMPMWCGGLLETGVGRAHNVALASLPGFVMPNDISASKRYFAEDIVEPEFTLNPDGTITVPKGHGIGVRVREDRLEGFTVKKKEMSG